MDIGRRRAVHRVGASVAMLAAAPASFAQAWPTKPPRAIVGFPAGGVVDVMARAVTDRMGIEIGQPVVVEDRPGAGSNLAVDAVLAAPRDGYTWLVSSNFLFVNPALDATVKWKFEDFIPVARYALSPSFFLVPADAPFSTLADWVAHARRNPGVQYGNGGVGTTQAMSMAMLIRAAAIRLDPVYYKGAPQMVQDIVGGQLSSGLIPSTVAIPVVKADRAKALAASGDRRSPALPGVPTFAEAGYPGATALSWYGLHVGAGTPPEVVRRIARAAEAACRHPDVQARLTGAGGEEAFLDPERFAAYVSDEARRWLPLLAGERKPGG